ncbi:ribonuclease HII [Psychromicrobium xiongbiense]|uniref:ribonuclease HII n=1 Tax=Psychromicrobium xiongbiense TaxID=3051184 RepID=UPI0025576679|nr:ribonuclease HII [Psychromicrobium sp. YIM S02556]
MAAARAQRATLDPKSAPTLARERSLMAQGARYIAGVDEVGRGALAGPVSVGLVVIDASHQQPLVGVRDSKLLSAKERQELVPLIQRWAVGYAVGHASAADIDRHGLTAALRMAGGRAWQQVSQAGLLVDAVLLDGSHNWLSPPEDDLFAALVPDDGGPEERPVAAVEVPVTTVVKGDLSCLSIAAASVLAKVERDELLAGLDQQYPAYGWKVNKGYATAAHRAAIASHGVSEWHRQSWRLTSS